MGTVMTDRRRAAARRVREIAGRLRTRGKLSREETTRAIRRVTGELADLAQKAAAEAAEHSRGFRQLVKSRTGCEGRISYLKRGYGWDRTRLDGRNGAAISCGHDVFALNLIKISTLAS
jgi:hypothetical protein